MVRGDEHRRQLFLDNDGVLADFDILAQEILGMPSADFEDQYGSKAFWKELHSHDDFFFKLPLMKDALRLWEYCKPFDPIILTGCPHGNWAPGQKQRWAQTYLETDRIITCASRDKRLHGKPGDVLVDDFLKHSQLWLDMGGVFIHHKTVDESIAELRKEGFINDKEIVL